jgi:hypothetical protein
MALSDAVYKAALRSGRFTTKDMGIIEAQLGEMDMEDILSLNGFREAMLVRYARDVGREAELSRIENIKLPNGINQDMLRRDGFLRELQADFLATTANDRMNLERLAELLVQRWNLSRTVMGTLDSDQARAAQMIDASILQLEKHLQIDPQTRAAADALADPAAVIGDWVQQSTDYFAAEGVSHNTNHGPAGYTVWAFKTPEYMPRCAKCGCQEFEFTSAWDGEVFPFAVATPEQVKAYVKGRDFKPEGAPSISIFAERPDGS